MTVCETITIEDPGDPGDPDPPGDDSSSIVIDGAEVNSPFENTISTDFVLLNVPEEGDGETVDADYTVLIDNSIVIEGSETLNPDQEVLLMYEIDDVDEGDRTVEIITNNDIYEDVVTVEGEDVPGDPDPGDPIDDPDLPLGLTPTQIAIGAGGVLALVMLSGGGGRTVQQAPPPRPQQQFGQQPRGFRGDGDSSVPGR